MKKNIPIALCGAAALLAAFCVSPTLGAQEPTRAANPADARRLTLSEAVGLALKNNREVLLSQTEVARAAAAHQEAQSVFRPEVYLGSGLAATKGFPLSIEGSAPSIIQISTQQSLINPNLRSIERQAGQMERAAQKSLEQKRDDIVAQTVLAYLDLDRSRRSVEYLRAYTKSLAEAEQIMAERVEAGLDPPVEGTKAKLNAARSRSQTVGVESQIAMLEFTLRDLTGMAQSEPVSLEEPQVPALPPDETLDRLVSRALENNEGIQALEDEVRAKEFQVKSEQASHWPRVNLVGQYGLFSDINNFSKYFQRFSRNNITAGVSILVPLFNRYRASALSSKAEAELEAAKLRLSDARAGIARQIRLVWGEVEQQSAAQEVAKLELEVARRSLDQVLAQFEDGRVNRLAVEQARSQENQSWVGFFQTNYQAEKARLELLRLSGEIRTAFH
jgi:outer membrane protein TolC